MFSKREASHKRHIKEGDIDSERSASAQVLQLVRSLQIKFPEDNFFDYEQTKATLHSQLIEGYGRLHDKNVDPNINELQEAVKVNEDDIKQMVEKLLSRKKDKLS